jgi:gamma-glutamyltranspeptidase
MGVPGEILGYFKAIERFGNSSISMKRLFEPTIALSENGIKVSRTLRRAITRNSTEYIIRKNGELL